MSVCVITGAAGLIGSEAAGYFADNLGLDVIGIDNDMRQVFFGEEASIAYNAERLRKTLGRLYRHYNVDIRNREKIGAIFAEAGREIELVIHTAAQPSHDWAAKDPMTDFDINAGGTLNLLEATRQYSPEAVFIFTSTNKVYGDSPNGLPFVEQETRFEIESDHKYADGIREDMSIDASLHSPFGASKLAADIMVQEYGRYFGMSTVCFRGGCLSGPHHSATQLHGFLAYVVRCTMTGTPYTVFGYKGKQVRDIIHSEDLIHAFYEFFRKPSKGEVYNIGGGRFSNCSVLEAIELAQEVTGRKLRWTYAEENRVGDHIWWINDNRKFQAEYPHWEREHDLRQIVQDIYETNRNRWKK